MESRLGRAHTIADLEKEIKQEWLQIVVVWKPLYYISHTPSDPKTKQSQAHRSAFPSLGFGFSLLAAVFQATPHHKPSTQIRYLFNFEAFGEKKITRLLGFSWLLMEFLNSWGREELRIFYFLFKKVYNPLLPHSTTSIKFYYLHFFSQNSCLLSLNSVNFLLCHFSF